jgi:hypothetical protein
MIWAVVVLLLSQPATKSAGTVVCSGTANAAGREFVLDRLGAGQSWRLSYRDREHPAWIRLTLDGASPVLGDGTATLRFRNANGGRQVELDVTPTRAQLDVYVDYGLEVNIDRDLAPDIDRMNTHGPLTSLSCQVDAPRNPMNP